MMRANNNNNQRANQNGGFIDYDNLEGQQTMKPARRNYRRNNRNFDFNRARGNFNNRNNFNPRYRTALGVNQKIINKSSSFFGGGMRAFNQQGKNNNRNRNQTRNNNNRNFNTNNFRTNQRRRGRRGSFMNSQGFPRRFNRGGANNQNQIKNNGSTGVAGDLDSLIINSRKMNSRMNDRRRNNFRGRRGRRFNNNTNNNQRNATTKESLDAQLDNYMGDDAIKSRLDADLLNYFNQNQSTTNAGYEDVAMDVPM